MKRYAGYINGRVMVIEAERLSGDLPMRLDLAQWSASPDWGSDTAGTRQLAIAVLANALGDDRAAVALGEMFATSVLQRLPARTFWTMSDNVVRALAENMGWRPQMEKVIV